MNILFCNSTRVYEEQGGTERITERLKNGLYNLSCNFKCFLAYKKDNKYDSGPCVFDDEINVTKDSLEEFILDHHIDSVIIQKMTRDVKFIYDIRTKYQLSLKIYSVLHFNPGYEECSATFHSFYTGLLKCKSAKEYFKDFIRTIFYPIYKKLYPLRNKELYKTVYKYSDKVILLSNSFIKEYVEYAGLRDNSKFYVIPNTLSFDDFLQYSEIRNKKKQVLVVSRLEENQKRISLAIKIWSEIEKNMKFNDWTFKIVGDGPDRKKYEELVRDLNLKRVGFCGRQNPKPYYEESSIFMMTSAYEGWGLTLTEAQQFGCVPLAFDTYSSVHDIIDNEKNGYIIEKYNVNNYVEKLEGLMCNDVLRENMAVQAIESCKRFELHSIIGQWEALIMK